MPIKKINLKSLDGQAFTSGDKVWQVTRLIALSSNFKPFKLRLKGLNIYNLYPAINSTIDFIYHMKTVNRADLSFPVILDDEGYVMDGRHRILKALMLNKKYVKAVKFKLTPKCCYTNKK